MTAVAAAPTRGAPPAAAPVAAAAAVVLASTALSGAIVGVRWLGFVLVAAAAVAAAGVLLRGLTVRGGPLPAPVVVAGQLFTLSCLLTAVFTRTGLLAVLPTPTALHDLRVLLTEAMDQVQTGVPPVDASTEMLLLVTGGLGLVAVAVDAIAVTAAAPAAAGLVLLSVFAVPASVSDTMLPWWSFVAGAAGFAGLLVVDGQRRHLAWRGAATAAPADAGAAPAATAVAGVALLVALLAGGVLTGVGTSGRLPGDGGGLGSGSTSGIGLKPFTALRGQLDRDGVVELFRVHGLDKQRYLRALTLRRFVPQRGWEVSGISGQPLRGQLPLPPDQLNSGQQLSVDIETLRYADSWLPVYGVPVSIQGATGSYRYDAGAGTIFSDRSRRPRHYNEVTLLAEPTAQQLREASGPDTGIDPEYFAAQGVSTRVQQLAADVTRGANTRFDRALAINNYLTDRANGFRYDLQTRSGSTGNALDDFLLVGKVGYCEQYASSMAVLLRVIGIPSRVVIGYTAGYESGDSRIITTDDAHAWVEVFFPGIGWVTFDPTPLPDARGVVPPHVESELNQGSAPGQSLDPDAASSAAAAPTTSRPAPTGTEPGADTVAASGGGGGGWAKPLAVTVLVLLLLAALVSGPATIRDWQRRSRLRAVATGGPGAATAAWQELLAESWDRGTPVPGTDTVRLAANRLARDHGLDDAGRLGLRAVVGAIERSWYGGVARPDSGLAEGLRQVRDSFRRNAPLALRARLLPRSVLRPARPDPSTAEDL